MTDKIIDSDEKKYKYLEDIERENKKKVVGIEPIYIEASRVKSSKTKPKNKRKKGCGCK